MIEEGENVGHVMEEVRRCIVFDVLLQLEILSAYLVFKLRLHITNSP